jgi:ribosomal protein S18 acetylase RimI-like enzyme
MPNPVITIKELSTDAEIRAAFPLMYTLRDRIHPDTFLDQIRTQEAEGYRLLGGYVDGQLVTLAGVRRQHTLARGPHAFVDDLVTHAEHRGRGYATALLKHIAARAAENGLPKVYLDARASALSYYDKLNFRSLTSVPCWIDAERLTDPPANT